ncbi:methyltransferase domain-containing protein [Roseovarius phycicola]|uniref:methyltransferase domain-containing protein n=1 Tax=Roseovarius phycicola TaxID=3080976 RepID=UPI0030D13303
MTDQNALERNRRRASKNMATFLHETAADELKDRLEFVKKAFTKSAIVSACPAVWRKVFDQGLHVLASETLNLDECSHDLVIHAISLHWANDPVGQLIQARRALKPDGLFLAVFFGGRTLHELRNSLAQAETEITGGLAPRIVPMGDIRDLGALLQRGGYALPVSDVVSLSVSYATPFDLMHDLRAMGEANAMHDRLRHFSRRDVFLRACEIYADTYSGEDGRVRATFELVVLTGWAPGPGQPQALRPGTATSRLADALGTNELPLKD